MNISDRGYHRLNRLYWLLKIAYGLLFIVAGLDKFTNIIVAWSGYVSPVLLTLVPLSLAKVLLLIAGVEIVIGLWILLLCSCSGGIAAAVWFLIIVVNLLSMHMYYDIAVRDVMLAIGALALSCITAIRREDITR